MNKTLAALLIACSVALAGSKVQIKESVLEDTLVLYALDAQLHEKPQLASAFFSELYKKTGKTEYLYQSLRMLEQANEIQALAKATSEALKKLPDDTVLKRFEVITLLKEGNYAQASQKALEQCSKSKAVNDYLLYAEARMKLADYSGCVSALKEAYAKSKDEATVERIALIMYTHLGEKKEAIKLLKEHVEANGDSKLIGKRLGSLYADGGDLEAAAQIYLQTYERFSDPEAAAEAVKIYLYRQDMARLTEVLEKSGINDPMLLEIYVKEKQFSKASKLAQKLYEQEDNPLYLAQSAVFAYEGSADQKDPAIIAEVIEKLMKAADDLEEPLYLNYLGYLMIEHDQGIDEGMGYVRRALAKQPDSPYYIDSLAWGHYKLQECAEALKLIKQVESMIGTDEAEVKEHLKAIESCKTKEK